MDEPNDYPGLTDDVAILDAPDTGAPKAPYDQEAEEHPPVHEAQATTESNDTVLYDQEAEELPPAHETQAKIAKKKRLSGMDKITIIGLSAGLGLSAGAIVETIANADSKHNDQPEQSTEAAPVVETEIIPNSPVAPVGATEIIPNTPVDCSEMNIDIPVILDADRAKEAVANIEFFIDDPAVVDQAIGAIFEANSNSEIEGIVQGIFESRGINVHYGLQAGTGRHESDEPVSLDDFKLAMSNFITAYSILPKQLAEISPEVYLANRLISNNPEDGLIDGSADPYGTNTTAYNILAFRDKSWGLILVWHELVHHVDAETCSSDFTQRDPVFDALRSRHELTAADKYNNYNLGTSSKITKNLIPTVISSSYSRFDAVEDKADTAGFLTSNYPDIGDSKFDESILLRDRQEIMMRRLAEALQIPEIPQLFQYFDIYGIDYHPKQIIADDLSPLSTSLAPRNNENYFLQSVMLPDGQVDNFLIHHPNETDYYMDLVIKLPASEADDCGTNEQVLQLSEMAGEVLQAISGGVNYQNVWVNAATIDPADGKLVCLIEASAVRDTFEVE